MFLYLTESLKEDLSNYNDNEAWPSLFDDFVDYQRNVITSKVRFVFRIAYISAVVMA